MKLELSLSIWKSKKSVKSTLRTWLHTWFNSYNYTAIYNSRCIGIRSTININSLRITRIFFFLQSNEIGGNGWRVQSCSVFWSFHIIRHSISLRTKWATTERLNTTIEKLFLTWAYTEASGTTFDSEPSPYIFKLWFYKKRTTRELELIYGITKYGLQMIKVVKTSMPIHKL